MLRLTFAPLLPLVLVAGCFAPTKQEGTGGDTDGATSSDTGASTSASTETGATTVSTTVAMTTTPADSSSDAGESSTGSVAGCGNGELDTNEGCDDGNTESGDGCSAACQDEALFCDPRVVGTYAPIDPLTVVTGAGEFPVVADDYAPGPAITLLDISDPSEPLFQSAINLGVNHAVLGLVATSDSVFGVGDPLVTALSITDGSLALESQLDAPTNYPSEAALQGTTLFIANDENTRIVDVANPDAMVLTGAGLGVGGVMFPSYDGVAAAGGNAYVSVNGTLGAFDTTDPLSPVLVSTTDIAGGGGLVASDDAGFIYYAGGDGIAIVDVSDPTDPVPMGTGAVDGNVFVRDVATRGNFVYAGTSNGNIVTFDAGLPAMPISVSELDIGADPAVSIHAGEAHLYVILGGVLHLVADLPGYCDATCGNGVTEYPELCDDGDLESGDECDADCTL
jgi:cysteine-rich repeat protein